MSLTIKTTRFALSTATAGNTQDVTISGFGTPKAVIFLLSSATVDDTITANAYLGVGFTDGTGNNCTAARAQDNSGTTITARGNNNAACISVPNSGGTAYEYAFSFNSWITDGLRLDIDTQSTNAYLITCIFIGGSDISNVHVGSKDDLGNGTSAVDINTVGFEPDIVFVTASGDTDYNAGTQAMISFGCGLNDGVDTQRIVGYGSNTGSGAPLVCGYLGNDSIIGQVWNDTLGWDGVIGAYDTSGFSITPNSGAGLDIASYLCIKFSTVPGLSLFDMSLATSGNYAETAPAFQPQFGMLVLQEGPSARNTVSTTGVATSISVFDDTNIYTVSSTDEDTTDPSVCKSLSSDGFRVLAADGSTNNALASSYSLDTDGWDFTLSVNPVSTLLGWGLAVETVVSDVTAPVLSLPTATTLTDTTASGTVTSANDDNGTLYWYVSTSGTPPSTANHKTGTGAVAFGNQAVTATGLQTVSSITGLTASTTYYVHYLHTDASSNDSNQATSSSFATYATPITINNVLWGTQTGWEYAVYDGGAIPSGSVMYYETGIDDTSANAAFLTVSTASWSIDEWVGFKLINVTDGSEGVITANTDTTITATLSGGTSNDWESGDVYEIVINADTNDQIVYQTTTSLSGTITAMSTKGVPTISGSSGTHNFSVKYRDATDSKVSSTVTVTVTV